MAVVVTPFTKSICYDDYWGTHRVALMRPSAQEKSSAHVDNGCKNSLVYIIELSRPYHAKECRNHIVLFWKY